MITGDSDEYWYIIEAVELSKEVEGACLELGLRLGMGTKTIIDAVKVHCPHKLVISIDPYGNTPYTGREPDGETHYDYTDDMRNECMVNIWQYVKDNKVDYRFFNLSDEHYFQIFNAGVPIYGYNGWSVETFYSMVHLDGPHTVQHLTNEIIWFNNNMLQGSTIVVDDVTIDFIDVKPIQELFKTLNWTEIKLGNKKGLWQKL